MLVKKLEHTKKKKRLKAEREKRYETSRELLFEPIKNVSRRLTTLFASLSLFPPFATPTLPPYLSLAHAKQLCIFCARV